jgi:hypothetical protein
MCKLYVEKETTKKLMTKKMANETSVQSIIPPVLQTTGLGRARLHFKKRISVKFDCSRLPIKSTSNKIWNEPALQYFSKAISGRYNNPAVYWFTILSNHSCRDIYNAILNVPKTTLRQIPHIPASFCETRTLYVGKVSSYSLRERMVTHLGCDDRGHIQGLQLCHWARAIGLKLQMECLVFSKEFRDWTLSMEKELAVTLHPLIGAH